MRHRKAGRRLGRDSEHRLALFRNLTRSLIEHERIVTTEAKAKELRPFVEKIITLAKQNTLHARRLVIARLGPTAKTVLNDKKDEPTEDTVLSKLFNILGPRFKDRPGGYTRIMKRHEFRLGDAGRTAFIELLKEGETKVKAKTGRTIAAAPAPAPVVNNEAPAPAPVVTNETTAPATN
jgi:large subunit ribosomal protein L17